MQLSTPSSDPHSQTFHKWTVFRVKVWISILSLINLIKIRRKKTIDNNTTVQVQLGWTIGNVQYTGWVGDPDKKGLCRPPDFVEL